MKRMNRDCYWCAPFGTECKALVEPVCKNGPCSFYETAAEYAKRTARFRRQRNSKTAAAPGGIRGRLARAAEDRQIDRGGRGI